MSTAITDGARVVRGEVRADGDERELPERQLPGPAGEHRRRHRDDQEHEHEGVVDEATRQALELRQGDADGEQQADPAVAHDPRERMPEQLRTAGAAAWRQGPRGVVGGLRPRADEHEQQRAG